MDVGTYNLISCKRDIQNNFVCDRTVNAFIEIQTDNAFTFNIMKSKVPLIEWPEAKVAYAVGQPAVDIAYSMPKVELRRPMKDGCLNPREKHAQEIMNIMVHNLIGDITEDAILCFSVPANAINETTDAKYHEKVLKAMFASYKSSNNSKIDARPINEALALVYAELLNKNYTGIGVSFGAGMVNLCYAIYGNPVFQFSIVNSGDWIDRQASKALGEETTNYVNKEKMKVDLSIEPESQVHRAIKAQYEIMIEHTVTGIKKGLEESKTRYDEPVDFVIAGGTASPNGFTGLFEEVLRKAKLPLKIGSIIRPDEPLTSVARGCLIAAENSR